MGTFAEKSSSPFKLRHQLSPQQLQSCQKSSKDRQKMLWIDLKTTLDVRFIAFSVANSNVLMCPFFLQFYHYLPSLASKTMLVSPEPEITGRVTAPPIVPNLEERPLVRVRRDLESAVYVSPILRVYFTFSWNLRNTTLDRTLPFICRRILSKINHIVLTRLWLQAAASYDVSGSSSSYWAINF